MVVQSLKAGPFDEALQGFKAVCRAETKTVMVPDGERFDIGKIVQVEKPEIILAIGASALKQAIKIRNTPVIYLMVLNPEKIARGRENVTGVHMIIPPEKYLDLMERLNLPKLRVGILYNPSQSDNLMKRITQAARTRGIEIIANEVHRPKDVPDALQRIKGTFNIFWMLPDTSVVTSETVDYLLLFTQEKRIPIIAFAEKYLEMGAMISLEIDSFDLGKQGGEIANRILSGERPTEIPYTEPRKSVLKINRKIAVKLGINLNPLASTLHTDSPSQNQ